MDRNLKNVNDFRIGNLYTNQDLGLIFNDFRKGIKVNSNKNIIAIITSEDSLYGDLWNDEKKILYYTGEGQTGDQSIDSRGNKAILNSINNNSKIYLFEKIDNNKYYYHGEVELCGDYTLEKEKDKNKMERLVIRFPLKLKNKNIKIIYSEEEQEIIKKNKAKKIAKLTEKEIHDYAKNKKPKKRKKIVEINYVERDQIVSKDTKNRAKGICDLCLQKAPFITKDGPYLECHHLIWIAKGGPDVIYNTVALCPNCHRKVHHVSDKKDFNKLKNKIKLYLENDHDDYNLIQYNELFKK